MCQPKEDDTPSSQSLSLIIVIGLLLGTLITVLLWLDIPNQIIIPLFWFSLGAVGLVALLLLRKRSAYPHWLRLLVILATVSLVYLFPELFRPVCGNTPRAFASPATRCGRCVDFVCEWNYKKHKEWCYCAEWDTSGCTVTQPPSIQATLVCSQWGQNGWCTGSLSLDLSALEPQGLDVMISGEVDEVPFACPASPGASTCSVPLPEGEDVAFYTATSTSGLTNSGSIAFKHDSVQPLINGSLNGVSGNNGWFISTVDVSASATDPEPASGLAAFEYNLNGVGWGNYTGPLSFSDGVHSFSLRASDAAGNFVETSQTIQVDTIAPTLDLNVTGAAGMNGWYVSPVEVNATAGDQTSGLAVLETSMNNGPWIPFTTPLPFSDGVHSYQFRALDQAGNLSETPLQTLSADTIPPVIDLPASWTLGQIATFKLQDDGSGLAVMRLVIEDEDERYPKVAWDESLLGNKFKGEIDWNGRFKDGTLASPGGEYYAWLKVTDSAGNESMQAGKIIVEAAIPPSDNPSSNLITSVDNSKEIGLPVSPPSASSTSTTSGSPAKIFSGESIRAIQPSSAQPGSMSFNAGGASNSPITSSQSNILWGTAAAAAIGAFAAEVARKKQEEAAAEAIRQAKRMARTEKNNKKQPEPLTGKQIAKAYQESLNSFKVALNKARAFGMSDDETTKLKEEVVKTGRIGAALGAAQDFVTRKIAESRVRKQAEIATRKEALLEPEIPIEVNWKQQDYAQLKHAREVAAQTVRQSTICTPENIQKPISWWEKSIDWADKHQTQITLAVGVAVGITAIILSGGTATPLVAAAWIAGSAALAGGTVAAGTMGLNAYYRRSLSTNVFRNLGYAAGAAAVTTGVGLFLFGGGLTSTLIKVGNGAAALCASNQTLCSYVEPAMKGIDFLEETSLMIKGAVQTWRGDILGATETANELQMEYMDGGVPGNAIARELGEEISDWITKYGDDAIEIISKYGDDGIALLTNHGDESIYFFRVYGQDVIPLLITHGNDAVDIIGTYGDEGITLLSKYGNNAIDVVKEYGTPAVNLLKTLDPVATNKLLKNLDEDVIEYALEQGSDAVAALSHWPDDFLKRYGDELALRAKQDARALKAAEKYANLKDLNTPEARELLDSIAYNSIQNSGDRLVLGKWVSGTLDEGFIGVARADGALFYGTNPGIEEVFAKSRSVDPEDLYWAVNNRVLEIAIEQDLVIDYSYNGLLDPEDIVTEISAIMAIQSGMTRDVVAREFFDDKFPFRMREVEILVSHGYKYSMDEGNNILHWIAP